MTETDTQNRPGGDQLAKRSGSAASDRPRRRRGRGPKIVRRCSSDGCERTLNGPPGQHAYCHPACRMASRVLTTAQRVCEAIGPNDRTGAYWAAAVTAADALVEVQRLDAELAEAARSVGMTREQWAAIKRGETTAQTTAAPLPSQRGQR